jgi:type IV secretion system protein VirB10
LASFGTSQFDNGNQDVENSSEALSDQLGKITASMIEENIDLAPIISVSGGERVGVQLLRDLYIRRPEPMKD